MPKITRPCLILLAALALAPGMAAPFAQAHAAQAFFSAIDDLPLPPGFKDQPALGTQFDSPEGRIVDAVAEGPNQPGLEKFFTDSLPALGWKPAPGQALTFTRERERLELTITVLAGARQRVSASLRPQGPR